MASQDYLDDKPDVLSPHSPRAPEFVLAAPALKSRPAFTDYGSEIEEIISSRLPFIVQWGTVIFFFILVLMAVICWFIQYPDIVTASGKLNSVNAPRQVVARTDGKLVRIIVHEDDFVTAGQILGYMESTADPQAVISVNEQAEVISSLINKNQAEKTLKFFPNNTKQYHSINLGELQPEYQTFIEKFTQFKDILNQGFLQRKKLLLLTDLRNIQRMHLILTEQRSLLLQDLALTNKTFDANKILMESKTIALIDYRNEKSKLLAKQMTMPQINANIVSNEGLLNSKREEIAELDNQISTRRYAFLQALQTIKSHIQAWEAKYLLKASVSGITSFTGFFQENQEVKLGQELFYIQPKNSSYFIEVTIPQYNFGKVGLGQQVAIRFQAYPFEQYGTVMGRVEYIDSSPTDTGYRARVSLPNGLLTNQKKMLRFQQGLLVQADIVTKNMRLLNRFYYSLSKQFKI
jgi:multidrug efflux pump subunit AcrA (membrane-fusion protein)